MHEIKKDVFYDLVKKYDSDSENHYVGEVRYYLLSDDRPYEGMKSHREALRFVFDHLLEKSTEHDEEAGKAQGGKTASELYPLSFDIGKARAVALDPREFLYCPKIVKTDYYGNVRYDADWTPNDDNFGTTVPYWYALLEPIYGKKNTPKDFKIVNEVLFPNGTDNMEIYEWTTDWSDIFDDGHEWWGASCWSVYDSRRNRFVVLLASATD
jgi:hypothetical protein